MAADGISEGEFTRAVQAVRDDIREGFAEVKDHLRTLNGKTITHGEAIAVLRAQHEAFRVRLEDAPTPNHRGPSKAALATYTGAAVGLVEVVKAAIAAWRS